MRISGWTAQSRNGGAVEDRQLGHCQIHFEAGFGFATEVAVSTRCPDLVRVVAVAFVELERGRIAPGAQVALILKRGRALDDQGLPCHFGRHGQKPVSYRGEGHYDRLVVALEGSCKGGHLQLFATGQEPPPVMDFSRIRSSRWRWEAISAPFRS